MLCQQLLILYGHDVGAVLIVAFLLTLSDAAAPADVLIHWVLAISFLYVVSRKATPKGCSPGRHLLILLVSILPEGLFGVLRRLFRDDGVSQIGRMCLLLGMNPLIRVVEIVKQERHVCLVVLCQVVKYGILLVYLDLNEPSRSLIRLADGIMGLVLALVLLLHYLILHPGLVNRSETDRGRVLLVSTYTLPEAFNGFHNM